MTQRFACLFAGVFSSGFPEIKGRVSHVFIGQRKTMMRDDKAEDLGPTLPFDLTTLNRIYVGRASLWVCLRS